MSTNQIRVTCDAFDKLPLVDKFTELHKPYAVTYAYPSSELAGLFCQEQKTGCWVAVKVEKLKEIPLQSFENEQAGHDYLMNL